MKTFYTILKAELKLSLRGMDMFIFSICMPVIVLVMIGIIYGNNLAFNGAEYTFLDQSFGAIATIAICAGGVMGLPLVVSDYRSKHILKRFKVTPVKPTVILLVQVTIYAIYALVSLIALFLIASVFFSFRMQGSIFQFIFGWLLVLISLFSIGTQGIKILKFTALGLPIDNMILPICILTAITIICSFISIKFFKWE